MTGAPIPLGKLPTDLLDRLLRALPAAGPEVLLGPRIGEDACAIRVPAGALVVATDPVTLTGSEIGRVAEIVNANDVAVTGARPHWFLAAVLLPPGTGEPEVEQLFSSLRAALDDVGAALVGGHTEVTDAVTRPVVVGQMLGLGTESGIVSTSGARAGDVVVQVGPAPVAGAAVFAAEARDAALAGGAGAAAVEAAVAALDRPGISVVGPALAAADLGATAMHDPTEGGLAAGLHELAAASDVRLTLRGADILWFEPGLALCRALGADPWATLASGSLLATFPADLAGRAVEELRALGPVASPIGAVEAGTGVVADGRPLAWPARDEVARVLGDR